MRLIPNTRDIWCRDYMPVSIGGDHYVQFRYEPRYLNNASHLRTSDAFALLGMENVPQSDLVVDGGNIVLWADTTVLTDRVYCENPKLSRTVLRARLREELAVNRLIIIPVEPGDALGHADGVLRLIDDRAALVNDYRTTVPAYGQRIEALLRNHGIEIIRCPYAPSNDFCEDGIPYARGVYVNYLQTPNVIVCPTYGLAEDDKAVGLLERCFPRRRVIALRCDGPAKEGGALNCLTWDMHGERDFGLPYRARQLGESWISS